MLERQIEAYLVRLVGGLGGECIKFKPIFRGLPDRLIFLPGGSFALVELKTAGRKPDPVQEAWHQRFRELGFNCRLIDSMSGVDNLIKELKSVDR